MDFILCKPSAAMRTRKSKWIPSYAGLRGTLASRAGAQAGPDTAPTGSYMRDQRATTSAHSCIAKFGITNAQSIAGSLAG
jgi:hypothetical protein